MGPPSSSLQGGGTYRWMQEPSESGASLGAMLALRVTDARPSPKGDYIHRCFQHGRHPALTPCAVPVAREVAFTIPHRRAPACHGVRRAPRFPQPRWPLQSVPRQPLLERFEHGGRGGLVDPAQPRLDIRQPRHRVGVAGLLHGPSGPGEAPPAGPASGETAEWGGPCGSCPAGAPASCRGAPSTP